MKLTNLTNKYIVILTKIHKIDREEVAEDRNTVAKLSLS